MDEEEEKEKKGREDRDRKVETGVEALENMRKKLEKRSNVRGVLDGSREEPQLGPTFNTTLSFSKSFKNVGQRSKHLLTHDARQTWRLQVNGEM